MKPRVDASEWWMPSVTRLGLAIALSFGTGARADTDQFSDRIIELPKFVVRDARDLPPPEEWRYARFDGGELLSSASDAETQRLVGNLQEFQQVLEVVWPMPRRSSAPLMLIICGRAGEFESFCPANAEQNPLVGRASLHLTGSHRSAIVIDLQTRVLQVDVLDANPVGTDTSRLRIDHAQQLRREYVRFLLAGAERRLPAWFEEGMAQLAMNIKSDGRSIAVGKIEESNSISAEAALYAQDRQVAVMQSKSWSSRLAGEMPVTGGGSFSPPPADEKDFNSALSEQALLSMERFLAVPRGAPETLNPLGANLWMKQAYAFVHLGLFGEGGRWRKPFGEFLRRSMREPLSEPLFKECFAMSYREMEAELRGYVRFTWYSAVVFKAKDGTALAKPPPIELRAAAPSEIGCMKGRAKQLAGHTAAARLELIAPYTRGERDAQLLGTLGLVEHAAGNDDRSRKFLQAAVAAKCTESDAYVQLARFRYADADAAPGLPDQQRFTRDQIAFIREPLLAARALQPPNPAVYEVLAETLNRSGAGLTEPDLVPLIEGVQLFPTHLRLLYQTAGLCAHAGLFDVARTLSDHGIKHAPDPSARVRFEQLRNTLPAR